MADLTCGGTVVIVDDDADIRETLRDFLEDRGFRVAVAANGAEALTVLKQVQPCFILLDLAMPVMNGWEFLQHCEQESDAASVPVYISTSAPEKAPAGFPVIAKPVDLTKILETARQHCEQAAGLQ